MLKLRKGRKIIMGIGISNGLGKKMYTYIIMLNVKIVLK